MIDSTSALAFVNTRRDRPAGRVETLDGPPAASAWLEQELGAQIGPLDVDGLRRLCELRDAAQRLLRARLAEGAPAREDLVLLNRVSVAAPRGAQLEEDWTTSTRFLASGATAPRDLEELLAALAGAVIALAGDPTADLAECGADDCVVIFLRTDPRQRWHSERCGNRMRAARSYARHRSDTTRDERAGSPPTPARTRPAR